MIRIGLVSAGSYAPTFNDPSLVRTPGSFHGTAFACTFNGFDADKAQKLYTDRGYTFAAASKIIPDCRVTRVWDPVRESADMLAEVCGIPEVVDGPDACAEDVDAVVIVDDGSARQYEYAFTPLRQGIPTFCDKPLAMTARECQSVAKVVHETGAKFMSASSLRFVPDILQTRREVDEGRWGDVWMATAACGNDLVYYGMHALSMAYGIFGSGAVSAHNVGQAGRNFCRVRFASGRDVMLIVGEPPWCSAGWQFNLYGSQGWKAMTPDLTDLYTYLLEAFVALLTRDEVSVPVDEEVELIATLEAGKRSLAEGREVAVAEVLAD